MVELGLYKPQDYWPLPTAYKEIQGYHTMFSSIIALKKILTFPPSALYSFSSPSKSLASPKSVIFTWFGDFTKTLRAAKSR